MLSRTRHRAQATTPTDRSQGSQTPRELPAMEPSARTQDQIGPAAIVELPPVLPTGNEVGEETKLKSVSETPTPLADRKIWIDGWLLHRKEGGFEITPLASKPDDAENAWPGVALTVHGGRGALIVSIATLAVAPEPPNESDTGPRTMTEQAREAEEAIAEEVATEAGTDGNA